jgi:large subunit ribosomal protein L22
MTATQAFTARHRYARITARKARLVADQIRGRNANQALDHLQFSPQRAAAFYLKVLQSAIANASQDENVNLNSLYVADCRADDGPMLNNRLRWRPGPQGRAMPFAKKTSHLTILVSEREAIAEVEETKPKAKPKAKKSASKEEVAVEETPIEEEVAEETPAEEEAPQEDASTEEEATDDDAAEEDAADDDGAEDDAVEDDSADAEAADEDAADDDADNEKQES